MQRTTLGQIAAPLWNRRPDLTIEGVRERVFTRVIPDGTLAVIVGLEPHGWHLSISHEGAYGKRARYPAWDEIADARYQFCPNDVTMAMLLPPREGYVNLHPTTFHLHQIA